MNLLDAVTELKWY